MIYHLILSPDAEDGLRSALLWYFQNDTNLPFRFETEFNVVLRRIAQNPNQFQCVSRSLRRALMKRFPYQSTSQLMTAPFMWSEFFTSDGSVH